MVDKINFKEAYDWCMQYPEIESWFKDISELTIILYSKSMYLFHKVSGLLPSDLLELAKEGKQKGEPIAERKIETIIKNANTSTRWKKYMGIALKSFYKHSYYDLAKKSLHVDIARKKPIRCPIQQEIKDFKLGMHIRDVTIVDFLACVPVREGTLIRLKWGHVWDELIDKPRIPCHIGIMGHELKGSGLDKYKDLEMHGFLHEDAVKSLLKYKTWREEVLGETITRDSWLFATIRAQSENKYKQILTTDIRMAFLKAKRRTGINISPHDIRRYVETQLEEARLQPNWIRKIMGKTIKGEEAPYSRPKIDQLRDEFARATPHLVLEQPKIDEVERRKQSICDNAKLLGIPEEKLNVLENLLKGCTTTNQIDEALEKFNEQKSNQDADCQKIITENELETYLSAGWEAKILLASGKIVIEK